MPIRGSSTSVVLTIEEGRISFIVLSITTVGLVIMKKKKRVVFDHFSTLMKKDPPLPCAFDINWGNIPVNEEVKSPIFGSTCDKAPGPDGFNGAFYKSVGIL
jgi:hypothetical protein